MRGRDDQSDGLFSYVRLEKRIPEDHPLRPIRMLVDEVLKQMSARFDALYAGTGRPSIAPEMLLRATLLQAFFSVRSERQLMEQIDYNLLFRWFVGLPMDAQVWHATVFCHNRDRLLEADVAREFLVTLMGLAEVKALLSREHFSVDGTLIEAWASMKSFRPSRLLKNSTICVFLIFGRVLAPSLRRLCGGFLPLVSASFDVQAAAVMSFGMRIKL